MPPNRGKIDRNHLPKSLILLLLRSACSMARALRANTRILFAGSIIMDRSMMRVLRLW
jgi:hypothetical protein